MRELLERNPELEGMLPENQPLWGILRFAQGRPTYGVCLETKMNAPEKVFNAALNLTKFFAVWYDGIIWDPQERQFGNPDAKTLSQRGVDASEWFTSLVENAGFEWSTPT